MPSRSAPGGNLESGTGQRERRCSFGGQAHARCGPCRRGSPPGRLTDAGAGTPGIGSPGSGSGTTGGLLEVKTTSSRLPDSGCWRAQDRSRRSEGRSSQLSSDTRRTRGAGRSETVRSDRVGDRTPEPVTGLSRKTVVEMTTLVPLRGQLPNLHHELRSLCDALWPVCQRLAPPGWRSSASANASTTRGGTRRSAAAAWRTTDWPARRRPHEGPALPARELSAEPRQRQPLSLLPLGSRLAGPAVVRPRKVLAQGGSRP